jgi:hypothetical protein
MNQLRFIGTVALVAALFCSARAQLIQAQCTGLHAGITAQILSLKPGYAYSDPEHVLLAFLVVNDSDSVRNVAVGSWKIVINGTELPDSQWIFDNGPEPVGGWNELSPGESYRFSKTLPVSTYFKKPGEYRVSWKAEGFQSPAILIRIPDK